MSKEFHQQFLPRLRKIATLTSGMILAVAVILAFQQGLDFLVTADQRGQRLMNQGKYQAAAQSFVDPFRQGVAYFRAGDFEQSASMFGGLPSAEAAFNQGNALVMLGKYEDAVAQYDRTLELRPEWTAAVENRKIAQGRADRLKFEGGDMTGGELGADGITFDENPSTGEQTETVEGGQEPGDAELREMWLRQVQTTPGEFLKAKFAYQLATAKKGTNDND